MEENTRKKLLITHIEQQEKNIKSNNILLGASAFAAGVGAIGVALLGDDVIYALKEYIVNQANINVHYKDITFAISSIALVRGVTSTISYLSNMSFYKEKLEFYKEKLEKEEGAKKI